MVSDRVQIKVWSQTNGVTSITQLRNCVMKILPNIIEQIVFLDPQNAPKSLAAGASPQTPLGNLQRSPRPPSWFKGAYFEGTYF